MNTENVRSKTRVNNLNSNPNKEEPRDETENAWTKEKFSGVYFIFYLVTIRLDKTHLQALIFTNQKTLWSAIFFIHKKEALTVISILHLQYTST